MRVLIVAKTRQGSGACIGAETPEQHVRRTTEAMASLRIAPWPFKGPVAIRERGGLREDLHVIDRWCHLGTVATLAEAYALAETAERRFDADAYRIVSGWLKKNDQTEFVDL